jgi:hypothetical protein
LVPLDRLHSLCLKTLITTRKEQTKQSGDGFEDAAAAFNPEFEMVKF